MGSDSRKYPSLRGGIQLQSESLSGASGTLGCLAETSRAGEARKIVILSVAHLLYAGRDGNALGPITTLGDRACHPVACSKCSRCCSDDIGRSLRGEFSQEIDAAVATLYPGTKYRREVEGIGPIRGTHQIIDVEAHNRTHPYRVRKRGIKTALTEGTVRLLDFSTRTRGLDDSFQRLAIRQIFIQPHTLAQAPITAILQDGVIRADGALFVTNGVTRNHFIEVSGPTRSRGLYKVHAVNSETEIVAEHPLAPDFPAQITPQNQPRFTPVQEYIFDPNEGNGMLAPGLGANNPGLLPFDMIEIRNSTSNNGIHQIRPLRGVAINQDLLAVYAPLTDEPVGAEIRGVLFIRVRDERFCDAADSGAVVVNDDQEVVGLLAGQTNQADRPDLKGYGFAAPINVVTDHLGINILTATNADEELVVDAITGEDAGSRVGAARRDGALLGATFRFPVDQREALFGAQQVLLETPGGRQYGELVRRHVEEVRNIINTNKRVAVVWRRNDGPLLAQLAFHSIQHPDAPIARAINGRSLVLCLSNILDILEKHGSLELRSALNQRKNSWQRFASMSFNELKHDLQNPQNDVTTGSTSDI